MKSKPARLEAPTITIGMIVQAAQAAAEDAIALHARNGVPLVYMRGGKIVQVDARRLLARRKAAARRKPPTR